MQRGTEKDHFIICHGPLVTCALVPALFSAALLKAMLAGRRHRYCLRCHESDSGFIRPRPGPDSDRGLKPTCWREADAPTASGRPPVEPLAARTGAEGSDGPSVGVSGLLGATGSGCCCGDDASSPAAAGMAGGVACARTAACASAVPYGLATEHDAS